LIPPLERFLNRRAEEFWDDILGRHSQKPYHEVPGPDADFLEDLESDYISSGSDTRSFQDETHSCFRAFPLPNGLYLMNSVRIGLTYLTHNEEFEMNVRTMFPVQDSGVTTEGFDDLLDKKVQFCTPSGQFFYFSFAKLPEFDAVLSEKEAKYVDRTLDGLNAINIDKTI
jgi:hypothetical protein